MNTNSFNLFSQNNTELKENFGPCSFITPKKTKQALQNTTLSNNSQAFNMNFDHLQMAAQRPQTDLKTAFNLPQQQQNNFTHSFNTKIASYTSSTCDSTENSDSENSSRSRSNEKNMDQQNSNFMKNLFNTPPMMNHQNGNMFLANNLNMGNMAMPQMNNLNSFTNQKLNLNMTNVKMNLNNSDCKKRQMSPTSSQSTAYSSSSNNQNKLTQNLQGQQSETYMKKYKTELCKNFEMKGYCKWGSKCCFAHGHHELRAKKHLNNKYKSKICKHFHRHGFCPYGMRCQYFHIKDSYDEFLMAFTEKLQLKKKEMKHESNVSNVMKHLTTL